MLTSAEDAAALAALPPARDSVSGAFAHARSIAHSPEAMPLPAMGGVASDLDGGCVEMTAPADAARFVSACGAPRLREREAAMQIHRAMAAG